MKLFSTPMVLKYYKPSYSTANIQKAFYSTVKKQKLKKPNN